MGRGNGSNMNIKVIVFFGCVLFLMLLCFFPIRRVTVPKNHFSPNWIDQNYSRFPMISEKVNSLFFDGEITNKDSKFFDIKVRFGERVEWKTFSGISYHSSFKGGEYSLGTWMPRMENGLDYDEGASVANLTPSNKDAFFKWLNEL